MALYFDRQIAVDPIPAKELKAHIATVTSNKVCFADTHKLLHIQHGEKGVTIIR